MKNPFKKSKYLKPGCPLCGHHYYNHHYSGCSKNDYGCGCRQKLVYTRETLERTVSNPCLICDHEKIYHVEPDYECQQFVLPSKKAKLREAHKCGCKKFIGRNSKNIQGAP